MDYFQGVVTEYLRADRAMFVNTECCIQLNAGANPDTSGPHWYCDAVAINLRSKEVFLCEVTYSRSLTSLTTRLAGWAEHWQQLRHALTRDSGIPADWPVKPWVFLPAELRGLLDRRLATFGSSSGIDSGMPMPVVTNLEDVAPWKYRSWNRTDN